MGVMNAIQQAKTRTVPKSAAMGVWESLSREEQEEIRNVLDQRIVGTQKLATLLKDEGVDLNHYFLDKVRRGEV